jgi:hypothetical protein
MENANTKSVSDSILELTKGASTKASDAVEATSKVATEAAEATSNAGSGIFGFLSSMSWLTWLMIILVLAFLGFNVFSYLAQGTQDVSNVFAPLLKRFFGITLGTASQTIDVAAEGGKAVTSETAAGVNAGLSAVQNITPNKASGSVQSTKYKEEEEDIEEAKSSLHKALNNKNNKNKDKYKDNDDYEPHEASSSVHTGKAGWCFIGEDRGYRTCSKVGENDKCMSGDIFPTQDICINPNLRP